MKAKRGDIILFSNGIIGIYEGTTVLDNILCSVCYNPNNKCVFYHVPVFDNVEYEILTDIHNNSQYIDFVKAIKKDYTSNNPDWLDYFTDSTYFEIRDWLWSKICVIGTDITKDYDVINEQVCDAVREIALYIFNTAPCNIVSADTTENFKDIFNKLVETAYNYELDKKHISTTTDKSELHEDTCRHLYSKLSNIRYGSEVMTSTSSEVTQVQEALFEMWWSCIAELKKRDVDIYHMIEWKLDKIAE